MCIIISSSSSSSSSIINIINITNMIIISSITIIIIIPLPKLTAIFVLSTFVPYLRFQSLDLEQKRKSKSHVGQGQRWS